MMHLPNFTLPETQPQLCDLIHIKRFKSAHFTEEWHRNARSPFIPDAAQPKHRSMAIKGGAP
ncbi:hypothetical protein J21TS3_23230 [Paenibacillus cookii]|uniref:Uncharacterized protein n=1 Tax=Paenibacillus cookii TaxID=157839 RepID=A0ABQ4LW84_9BACL|nr:hypothetical protein J21TS3_23230 [Paenibacillus cookii]